jgi:Holliday junction resolvase
VKERVRFQRDDGKNLEIDVFAESSCGRVVLVEVKKTQAKTGLTVVEEFQEKVTAYQNCFPATPLLPAFFSVGGFTEEALRFGEAQGIGMTEQIEYF